MRTKIFQLLIFSLAFIACQFSTAASQNSKVQLADRSNLSFYLSQIVRPKHYRNYQNIDELNRVSFWLKGQMEKFGIPCEFQNYLVNDAQYRNVICKLNVGTANTLIVGAHYDVHDETDGADDNASGVAGVIETAQILAKERNQLNHNVEFVFYTLEEPPFFRTDNMGSAVHVKSILNRKDQIKGVYILEMIGYFDRRNIQEYPVGLKWFYPDHGNFIGAVSNMSSSFLGTSYCDAMKKINRLDCQRLVAPSFITGVDFSDHLNYWNHGIPATMITDTAFFRNKNYHTHGDTIDTLNIDKMKDVVDGVVLSILSMQK
ncbi:M20/M25/M40 family metallo-hydrolase [Acinetobacter sp. 194]|uniref:M20/M25/M40 family metallo-hydrolase n=1 Tax=Acinetobacter shaoyimingii TaxID=2715164 RepID=UPI00140BD4E8|nr:M20/M25/M40 family metallo-hydrolase [Acinetobacter shaoyimingii]NHB58403.1 M20/M25/M40 family metallo-hydrolase [Acinetobacter shaoyimingii]